MTWSSRNVDVCRSIASDPFVAKVKSQVTIDFDYKMNYRMISRKRLLVFSVTFFYLGPIFKNFSLQCLR